VAAGSRKWDNSRICAENWFCYCHNSVVILTLLQLNFDSDLVSYNIRPSQLYFFIHDILKAWFAPFLGSKTHHFYVRFSTVLGC
jgi:hypothetical protein